MSNLVHTLKVPVNRAWRDAVAAAAEHVGISAASWIRLAIHRDLIEDGFDPATFRDKSAGELYDLDNEGRRQWCLVSTGKLAFVTSWINSDDPPPYPAELLADATRDISIIGGVGRSLDRPDFDKRGEWLPVYNLDSEPFDRKRHWRLPPEMRIESDRIVRFYPVVRKSLEHA